MRAVAYFHTDHFEPWRQVPGRDGGMERGVDDVAAYLQSTASLDFARKASLFYKANVNYMVSGDRGLLRADPDDLLGFLPRTPHSLRIGRAMIGPIAASAHELQIHLHHENFTYNDTARDPETFAYLQTPRGRSFDNARLELAIRLGLETVREDAGIELTRWFFVHGHWALNASDPHECTIVREIELLQRNGCLGDFTQPAGRGHVDSRIDVPYLVDPVAQPKGYDSPLANPVEAAGAGASAAGRFFIWASATTHGSCSIDTYSPSVERRLKTPEFTALDHARNAVVIDGVLFLKTHCHSLNPLYWKADGLPTPQADPRVQAELRTLFDAADGAGLDVDFQTASEIYDRILGAAPPPKRDLIEEFDLRTGSAMEPIGLTVDFMTPDGARTPPPPLAPRPVSLPALSVVDPQRTTGEAPDRLGGAARSPAVAYVVPLNATMSADADDTADEAMIDAAAELPELMAARDVVKINLIASRVARARSAELGSVASGVTNFYGSRAERGVLLQPSEVLCAAFVGAWLPRARGVYEIGCGLGLLTSLLAARGVNAIGLERNGARLTTAKAIATVIMEELKGAGRPSRLVRGVFPKALRRKGDLATSVALVTNLLGSATPEQQEGFIAGLRAFGAVMIDVQRFYTRRSTRRQIADLLDMLAAAGFEAPRLAFDLGPDGRFMVFTNPTPRRRPGLTALLVRLGAIRDEPLLVKR
ncbi:MAG: hypothetical protein H0X27_00190 [Caulobacteraceae bacterium]|nr:hypothetical protein [Caulobacteraceae bacterium]